MKTACLSGLDAEADAVAVVAITVVDLARELADVDAVKEQVAVAMVAEDVDLAVAAGDYSYKGIH